MKETLFPIVAATHRTARTTPQSVSSCSILAEGLTEKKDVDIVSVGSSERLCDIVIVAGIAVVIRFLYLVIDLGLTII